MVKEAAQQLTMLKTAQTQGSRRLQMMRKIWRIEASFALDNRQLLLA